MIVNGGTGITISDVRGDLHGHSDFSDGRLSIEDSILKAISLGYDYIAITDHSQSLHVACGLTVDMLEKKFKEIERCRAKYPNIIILNGSEVDILQDGSLDYPDSVLKELDIVIASIHLDDVNGARNMTERLIAACKNSNVDIIGHPTCRLAHNQKNIFFNMNVVAQAAADMGVALEINCNKPIIDLNRDDIIRARKFNVKFSINTDFHEVPHMDRMKIGVSEAVSGGLKKDDIINCLNKNELLQWLKR
jgi:DNA polymerase (family 10)